MILIGGKSKNEYNYIGIQNGAQIIDNNDFFIDTNVTNNSIYGISCICWQFIRIYVKGESLYGKRINLETSLFLCHTTNDILSTNQSITHNEMDTINTKDDIDISIIDIANLYILSSLDSERYLSTYSMASHGIILSDLNTHNLNLIHSELSSLHSKNIIFDSYNGTIFISAFDQSTYKNGISADEMKFIAATQNDTNSKIILNDGNTISMV